jgi:hypothetical protein
MTKGKDEGLAGPLKRNNSPDLYREYNAARVSSNNPNTVNLPKH